MPILENINDKFFNPFCCKNREVYLECICLLIEKSKEIPILYETDARNCLILYLQNSKYSLETEDIGEEINNNRAPQENASAILRYFRRCGWITPQEIGRSGDNIASVSAYCRKLIDAVYKIFGSNVNGAITNHIFSIYEILSSSFGVDSARAIRPYTSIMEPLIEQECDLKNELLILKDSIREIMRAVMRMTEVNLLGQYLIKDELLNRFFNDYFFVKRSGLIPAYISNIDRLLRKLRRSELYEKMVKEYISLKNVDEFEAKELIDRQFGELDSFINLEYDQEMNYIDRKINTYYSLYSVRVSMVLSNSTNLEQVLNRLLLMLKDLDAEDREWVLMQVSQTHRLMSIGFIGRKSFQRRRKANPNMTNAGFVEDELSEDEKKRLTEELLTETPDRYSMDNVENYFSQLTKDKEHLSVEECQVHTKDDAMMIAASIVYSGTEGFPYEVEFGEGMVQTEAAEISRVQIKRKSDERRK